VATLGELTKAPAKRPLVSESRAIPVLKPWGRTAPQVRLTRKELSKARFLEEKYRKVGALPHQDAGGSCGHREPQFGVQALAKRGGSRS
jgi:hypothetical protein